MSRIKALIEMLTLKKGRLSFDFEESIRDESSLNDYIEVLNIITKQSAQIFRANHGGGMPCPDNICSTHRLLDNF